MRSLILAFLTLATVAVSEAHAIPAWARKYNMNCSGCHLPTVPRLNATGIQFKWAGYRMPDEIGEQMEVKKIEEYLAARGILRYSYAKTEREPADENSLGIPTASVFAAGPVGARYGAFFEFEREAEGTVDLTGQAVAVWGKDKSFGGVRLAQGHILVGGAVAGFDRATGILTPLPLSAATTTAVPFRFSGDQSAIEAFYVLGGRNRTSVQLLNGTVAAADEAEMEGRTSTKKNWLVSNQLMWDDDGAGLTTIAYFGNAIGLDEANLDASSRFTRLAASANKYFGSVEILGGYVYSKDSRLPVGVAPAFPSSSITGSAFWVSGQYYAPKTFWTVFGRYEFLDPNRDGSDDALRRFVVGSVLPVNVPEYIRLGVEYFRDMPQLSDLPRRHGITGEMQIAF